MHFMYKYMHTYTPIKCASCNIYSNKTFKSFCNKISIKQCNKIKYLYCHIGNSCLYAGFVDISKTGAAQ